MAKMAHPHSQTPIPPLSSSLHLLPLEDNHSSSQIKQNPKRKLEDYLDPLLLHTISSRIGGTETKEKQMKKKKKDVFVNSYQATEFDWPVYRLDPLINDPNRDSGKEYDGARFSDDPLSRRSDFPMWKGQTITNTAQDNASLLQR